MSYPPVEGGTSAFMPPGAVPPFVVRLDTGSAPVGYLVLDSETERSPGELQDLALYRVRPIFGSLQGVSSPPPIGGNLRTINVNVDPDRLNAYKLTLDDINTALANGNAIVPSGNVRIGDQTPMVPVDAMVARWQDIADIPVKPGAKVYLRDVAAIEDGSDIATGYAIVNGKRTVDVPESEAALVTENMPVTVRIQARGDQEIPARVSRLSWALDQSSRTLHVQVDLPNADGALRPGMFAIVRFSTERPGAWMAPASVVVTTDEQPYGVRVENGKTIRTPVKLGARQNGQVELIQKQTRPIQRGEPIPWESLTGAEDFLLTRPAGWTDGMRVGQ